MMRGFIEVVNLGGDRDDFLRRDCAMQVTP
jgi:hypothetical protein